MAEKQYFVTEEGLAALEKELEYLKSVRRKEVAEKIKVALSFGDLSENSEYDEAKNDQAMVEARIADLEVMLKGAVVIDESELNNETVHIGSKIEVELTSASPTGIIRSWVPTRLIPAMGRSPMNPPWARP